MKGTAHRYRLFNYRGISLIEVTMLIVIVAIMAAVAMKSMTPGIEDARKRKTEHEMQIIVNAIVGDPSVMSVAGGVRSDFGYVGDIGAFPPDLNALVENPGGYTTWNGSYIPSEYLNGFDTDEWGNAYSYSGGLDIVSTGSGSMLKKHTGSDSLSYLINQVYGWVRDVNDSVPGTDFLDSVDVEVTIPDGTGSTLTKLYRPDSSGNFMLDSIPMGRHLLEAIYTPEVDTLRRYVTVLPRHSANHVVKFNFPEPYFSAEDTTSGTDSMLTLVEGSETIYGGSCESISFDVANNTGDDVTISSITLTWDHVVSYYQRVYWDGTEVFNSSSPRYGSGQEATFVVSQTITDGSTLTIAVENFRTTGFGNSDAINMSGTTFTVEFSDGSTFDVTVGSCS